MKFEWAKSLKFKLTFIFFVGISIAFGINWFVAVQTVHAEKVEEVEKVLQHLLIESTDEYISTPLTLSSDVSFLYTIPHNGMILSDSEVSHLYFVVSNSPRITHDQMIAASIKVSGNYYLNALSDYQSIDASVNKYAHKLFIRYFFSLLFILIVVIVLLEYYLKPLAQLARKTREWKREDPFDLSIHDASTEIQEVSNAFVMLVRRIEGYHRKESELFKEAAHELKTPLALMRSRLDVYENSDHYNKEKFTIDLGHDIERLTGELKNVLFLESSDFEEPVTIDIAIIFHSILQKMGILIQRKQLSINTVQSMFKVHAPEKLITKVLGALLENAITYAKENTTLTIGCDQNARSLWIANVIGDEKYLFSSKIGNKMLNRLSEEIGYTYHIEKDENTYKITLFFRDAL